MMKTYLVHSLWIFLPLNVALASSPTPQVSAPVWVVPPSERPAFIPEAVELQTSKNNGAISYFNGRLYLAFRTAPHHQTRPPSTGPFIIRHEIDMALRYLGVKGGLPQFLSPSPPNPHTRMYVLSAEVTKETLRRLQEKEINALRWRLEFEAHDRALSVLRPALAAFQRDKEKISNQQPLLDSVFGKEESTALVRAALDGNAKKIHAAIEETDLREPLFLNVSDHLIFYFISIEAVPFEFNPLRTWAMTLDSKGEWSGPVPILAPKEMLWEVKADRFRKNHYYATSYHGDHYHLGDQGKTSVFLKESVDGLHWNAIGGRPVYEGGANETGFEFDNAGSLWAVMRLDDGDLNKGWGSLVAHAKKGNLSQWEFPNTADPRRYDSPRMFRSGKNLYLVAREHLIPGVEGNAPFDLAFLGKSQAEGQQRREAILKDIREGKEFNKTPDIPSLILRFLGLGSWAKRHFPIGLFYEYEFTYWAKGKHRTALYRLNEKTRSFEKVASLPSAGDTAFPSFLELSDTEFLVLNYSSPFEASEWPWARGQQNPTGLYLLKLKL